MEESLKLDGAVTRNSTEYYNDCMDELSLSEAPDIKVIDVFSLGA
jgi:hypothetical protein